MSDATSEGLVERVASVRARIREHSPHPERVRLIGVTKGFGPDAAVALHGAGVVDLGENYAQELESKAAAAPDATWHFLGPVQRNKLRLLVDIVDWWHAVDRVEVGEGIAGRRHGAHVLVQVNVSESENRPGVSWDDAPALVDALRRLDLDVCGLMAVASPDGPAVARAQFDRLARIGRDLGLSELSIGMSGDLDEALRAGSTMVRVGTALLGARPQTPTATE